MPTAAKLVSALLLAVVGWFAADAVRPLMPEQTQFGRFNEVAALIGVLVGWRVVGNRVQGGITEAFSGGLTGAAALVFWNLFVQSFNTMLGNALDRKYDGPFEGIIAVFYIAMDYAQYLTDTTVLSIIIVGGVVTGIIANRFA
jgi:hypothetical protein